MRSVVSARRHGWFCDRSAGLARHELLEDPLGDDSELTHLQGGELVEHEPSHVVDVIRSGLGEHFLPAVRELGVLDTLVARTSHPSDPVDTLDPRHRMRQTARREIHQRSKVTHPEPVPGCVGQRRKDGVVRMRNA